MYNTPAFDFFLFFAQRDRKGGERGRAVETQREGGVRREGGGRDGGKEREGGRENEMVGGSGRRKCEKDNMAFRFLSWS